MAASTALRERLFFFFFFRPLERPRKIRRNKKKEEKKSSRRIVTRHARPYTHPIPQCIYIFGFFFFFGLRVVGRDFSPSSLGVCLRKCVYIHIGKRKRHQMASHQTFWLRFFLFFKYTSDSFPSNLTNTAVGKSVQRSIGYRLTNPFLGNPGGAN